MTGTSQPEGEPPRLLYGTFTVMRSISLLALALCAALMLTPVPAVQAADALTVVDLPSDTGGQIYYADALGYFKAAGLDVNIVNMTNSPAIVTAVTSGSADIGFAVIGSALLARQRGIAVHFIAPGALWVTPKGTAELVVAKDSPIRRAADFAGKTIAVTSLADLSYFGTRAWLAKNGVDPNAVKFVELPFPAMGAAVGDHRVDGAMIAEPFLTAAKDVTRDFAPVDDAVAPRFLVSGWLASDAWIRAHADVAARFAAVMAKTSAWANANEKASAAILAQYAKISPEVAAAMHRDDYATTLDPKLMQPPIDAVVKNAPAGTPVITASDLIWTPGMKL